MGAIDVCLSHDTAFRWLMRNRNPRVNGLASNARVLPLTSPSSAVSRQLVSGLSLDDEPLEVLVCRLGGRRDSSFVKSHISGAAFPAGSFVRVEVPGLSGVYTASPELVFRQIAAKHSLLETVYVGFALCSAYRVDGSVEGGIAIREGDDAPLTTVDKIDAYLRKTEGTYGCAKARRALSYVRERSMSPLESALAMGLSLPACLGGFHAGDVMLQGALAEAGDGAVGCKRRARRCVSLTMAETGCGKGPVSMMVISGCEDDGDKRNGMGRLGGDGRSAALSVRMRVTPSQVYEFGSYVQLCEKVRQQLATRDRAALKLSEQDLTRREAIRARQADLWRTLVCFSAFRQGETGDCVNVFDPPRVRGGR